MSYSFVFSSAFLMYVGKQVMRNELLLIICRAKASLRKFRSETQCIWIYLYFSFKNFRMSKMGELIVLTSQLESTGLFGFCFCGFLNLFAIDSAGLKKICFQFSNKFYLECTYWVWMFFNFNFVRPWKWIFVRTYLTEYSDNMELRASWIQWIAK